MATAKTKDGQIMFEVTGRPSGVANTSLGNTLINIFIWSVFFRNHPDLDLYYGLSLFMGDDSLLFLECKVEFESGSRRR